MEKCGNRHPGFPRGTGLRIPFTVEHHGRTYPHLRRVTEVTPERELAYTWRYEVEPGESRVVFALFARAAARGCG